jgi:hypothetical protein
MLAFDCTKFRERGPRARAPRRRRPALGDAMVSIGPPTLYERQQDEEEKAAHPAAQARAKAYVKARPGPGDR